MISALLGSTSAIAAASGGGFQVDLPATTQSASDLSTFPDDATAGWRFNRNGTIDRQIFSWSYRNDWGTPTGGTDGDDYQIKVTLNSGVTPSGLTMGVWYALSGSRIVYLTRGPIGTASCNLTVSIRDAATLTVQDTQTYTISVSVDSGL